MKQNMGSTDRKMRSLIAAIIGILVYMEVISGTVGTVLLVLAVVFLLTSFLRFCPLYLPFGINTCETKKE